MPGSDENFLARWSRRKLEAREERKEEDAEPQAVEPATAPADQPEPTRERPTILTEADFADVDFDALDANSDYTRFMAPGVPATIRTKALRRLWSSDPVLSAPDGLFDYADDYTDAARAVPEGTLKTAYRIGRGFLSDEEAAEWEQLGRPPEPAVGPPEPPPEHAPSHVAEASPAAPDAAGPPPGDTAGSGGDAPAAPGDSAVPEDKAS